MRIPSEFLRLMADITLSIPFSQARLNGMEGGVHSARRVGNGTEFANHQCYSPGDDLRYLDWKLYARHSTLQTKKFCPDESRMIYLFIDTTGSMDFGTPNKFDYALLLAAGILFLSLRALDTINIITRNNRSRDILLKCRHRSSLPRLIRFLESLKPGGRNTKMQDSCRLLTDLHLPSGPIWILSDFYDIDRWLSLMHFLRFHHFLPLPIRITAPEELRFPYSGSFTLTDLETGRKAHGNIAEQEKKEYENRFRDLSSRIQHSCCSAGIRLREVSTDFPPEKFLLHILREFQ